MDIGFSDKSMLESKCEKIKISKDIYNGTTDEPIELNYQFPDYCPRIFKMIQYNIKPNIYSCNISQSNKELIINGNASFNLIYIDDDNKISSIMQNIPFSKSIELEEESTDPTMSYSAKLNYSNCKIIDSQQIEVKGAVSITVKVQEKRELEILSDVNENSIQIKREPILINSNTSFITHQFNLSEQINLEYSAKEVLNTRICPVLDDFIIENNAITVKGTAYIDVLYCDESMKHTELKRMDIKFSEEIKLDDISEKSLCIIKFDVLSIDTELAEEGKVLNLSSNIMAVCHSTLPENVNLIVDAYSTTHELKTKVNELNTSEIIGVVNEIVNLPNQYIKGVNFENICDVNAEITDLICENMDNSLKIKAKLHVDAFGIKGEDSYDNIKKMIPIEFKIDKSLKCDNTVLNLNAIITNARAKISNSNLIIDIEFRLSGYVLSKERINIISDIIIDKDNPVPKTDVGVTLFYPNSSDDVWNIAKKFHTTPNSIMEANDLESEIIDESKRQMIMVPRLYN